MSWRIAILALAFAALSSIAIVSASRLLRSEHMEATRREDAELKILIVPVGVTERADSVPASGLLDDLAAALRESVRVEYEVAEAVELPGRFLDAGRGQVEAHRALSVLAGRFRARACFRLLFVTEEDLFVPGLNFVFGLAAPGGRAALVSDARFGVPPSERSEPDRRLHLERLAKVALHELGHTLLLSHSEDSRSVMKFHNSVAELDASGGRFTKADIESILKRYPELEGRVY